MEYETEMSLYVVLIVALSITAIFLINDVTYQLKNVVCGVENITHAWVDPDGIYVVMGDITGECLAFVYKGGNYIIIDNEADFWGAYFHEKCHLRTDTRENSFEEETICIFSGYWDKIFAPRPELKPY